MSQAYDSKNDEDFENNTETIIEKLDEIRSNPRIATTISSLAKLTGLHRNTLSARGWPAKEIKDIKEQRKKKTLKAKQDKVKAQINIEEKLDLAKRELVFWYRKTGEADSTIEQLKLNLKRMTDAKNDYVSLLKQEREKSQRLEEEIRQLNKLLMK